MTLKELQEKLAAKQADLAKVFEEAGEDLNFSNVKCLGDDLKNDTEKVKRFNEWNAELNELGDKVKSLQEVEAARKAVKDLEQPRGGVKHPTGGDFTPEREAKSFGEMITSHEGFANFAKMKQSADPIQLDIGMKTLFETGAGWAPESIRSGRLVDAVTRPIQILDLIPMGTTGQAAYVYMEETTRTHAAAEKAEGAAFAESTFVLTERTSTVRKITDSVPVTDEQLEDVAGVQGYLDGRLRFGLQQRLDSQVLNGDGIAPNLSGILNTVGIQTQAKGADPTPDAVYKALTKVRLTGRAMPNGVVMHPNDWQEIRLLRTADGVYIWGNPSEAGPERIWGLPVAQSDAISEGTGLVGDFANFCSLFERRGIEVKMSDSHDDFFTKGKQMIRADMRAAFVVFRPTAFATVTGI